MIQSRGLAIDVAARRVLSDASFTVNTGDKVGLVGRNGVGKTSLLKVLAGEDDAAAGLVLRRGTLGYVPQNPRPRAEAAHSALSHILSGRGLDRAAARLVELHQALEQDHSLSAIEKYSEAEERYRLDGGYSGESEARRIVTGLGLRLDRVDLALGAPPGGGDREVELAGRGDAATDGQAGEAGEVDLHPRGEDEGGAGGRSASRAQGEDQLSRASAQRPHRDVLLGTGKRVRRAFGVSRHDLRGRAARSVARDGPERSGQDEPAADPGGRERRRSGVFPAGARGLIGLLRAGARGHPPRRSGARAHAGAGARRGGARPARVAWDVQPHGGRRAAGRGHAVGRREDEAGPCAAGGGTAQPAPARRADEQPGPAVADRRGAGTGRLAGNDGDREPRSGVRGGTATRTGLVHAGGTGRLLGGRPPRRRCNGVSTSRLKLFS